VARSIGCLEEAIGQNADMQCAGEACEKRAQPRAVCDHRREWAELIGGRVHGLGNPGTGWTVERVPGAVLIEIGEDIVELAKGALRVDLGTEPGSAARRSTPSATTRCSSPSAIVVADFWTRNSSSSCRVTR
jgi:hypothetical protein